VFDKIGVDVLDNAWEGYHTCLFAYGQTGAGKSHSMIGYGNNKGVVPLATEEIFKRIDDNKDKDKSYEVTALMCEIYNEKVQDLTVPVDSRPKNGLKIRESNALGIYVEGLSKHAVSSYIEIQKVMEIGEGNRSKGATQMNAESSRSHTIIQIEFKSMTGTGSNKT
jgi:kinesin family protein 13